MSLITAYGSVNGYILKQMDRFAKMKKTIKDTLDAYTSTKFWVLIDSTANEVYENRLKGSNITNIDSKLNEAKIGNLSQDWFSLHTSYFSQDLGLNGLSGYLDAVKVRVHEDFGNVYFEATGSRLSAKYVWADPEKDANILYSYAGGEVVQTATSLPTVLGDTRLVATGGGVITTITVGDSIGNTATLTGSLLPPTDGTAYIGESVVTSIAVADTSITLDVVARAACFKVGQYVMIQSLDDSDLYEIVKLHATTAPSVSTGVLTLAAGTTVKYDYTAAGANVFPLYNKVTAITGGVVVTVKPVNDRTITWGE